MAVNYPNDAMRQKWEPVLRWIPQVKSGQARVLVEEALTVPMDHILSHIWIESRGNPQANNEGNSFGLMQLTPPNQSGVDWDAAHIFEPEYNIYKGITVLARKRKYCCTINKCTWEAASMAFFSGGCVLVGQEEQNGSGYTDADYLADMQQNKRELADMGVTEFTEVESESGSDACRDACDEKYKAIWEYPLKATCRNVCIVTNLPNPTDIAGNLITGLVGDLGDIFARGTLVFLGMAILALGLWRFSTNG